MPRFKHSAVIAHHQTVVEGKHEPVAFNVIPDEQAGVYYAHELAERGFDPAYQPTPHGRRLEDMIDVLNAE